MSIIERLEKWNKSLLLLVGGGLILGIGFLDFVTGFEIAFSLFYVIPITLVTWFVNKKAGIIASVISAAIWLSADYFSGNRYSDNFIFIWNTLIRFGFFLILTILLSALKTALEYEKSLTRIDRLTGATSVEYFYELLQDEINRFRRYSHRFTVAYLDLDNFKAVNDRYGHSTGDLVLQTIVKVIRIEIRKTDIVARLGGDEFALLFLETDTLTAQEVIKRIQLAVQTEMEQNNWPVTVSVGVITFSSTPDTANEIIRLADDLVYSVKNNGKNGFRFAEYPDSLN